MIINMIKGILKFIFIAFGLLCILAAIGDDSGDRTTFIIVAVISLIIGASIETKKKEQPQSAQQSRRTQPVLSQADRRRIEDRKRLLLNEMQMCQQRINECYMENKIESKSKDTDIFSLFSMGSNFYAVKKDQEYLNKLREEYDELSNL